MLEILIFSGLCVFLVYLFNLYTSRSSVVVSGIPGPSFYQLLQHTFKNRRLFGDTIKMLNSFHDVYGPTFCIHVKPFSPFVVTGDHNYFGQILASKEYLSKPPIYDFFKNVLGDSLVISQIDIWENDRKFLNRGFEHKSFKVFLECLDKKLHELEDKILDNINAPIDMDDVLQEFILHVTIESLKDPSIAWDPARTNDYNRSSKSYKDFFLRNILTVILNLGIFLKWATQYNTAENDVRVMKQYAIDMVDVHLKTKEQLTDPNNIIYKMHEANIPYERIVDNVVLFIEAAHETTATTLAYLFFEIAKRPDVQNKICEEIEAIVGKDPNATISAVDLQQMKYVHCVVKEGLRINSTASYVMRKLYKPAVVNNATVPNGANIIFNIQALHKSDAYFVDPYAFNPDRFSDENKRNLVRNSWAPFSLGIRNCLGKSLAMQQMKLILAKMIRRFEFTSVVPEHKMDIKATFLAKSMNGVPVLVKVRDVK